MFNLPVYILDSKNSGDFAKWPLTSYDEAGPVYRNNWPEYYRAGRRSYRLSWPIVVWKPPDDDLKQYDAWLNGILKARVPAIIVIDELSSLGKNKPDSFVPGLIKLMKQGRGLHMPMIVETQESCFLPRQILGQSTHYIRFQLKNKEDNTKLDNLLAPAYPIEDPFGFNYYVSRVGHGLLGPWYYRDHSEFFLPRAA